MIQRSAIQRAASLVSALTTPHTSLQACDFDDLEWLLSDLTKAVDFGGETPAEVVQRIAKKLQERVK